MELSGGKQHEKRGKTKRKTKTFNCFVDSNDGDKRTLKSRSSLHLEFSPKSKISPWFQQLSIIGCHLSPSTVRSVGARRRFKIFVSKQIPCRKSEDGCSLCRNGNTISTLNIKLNYFCSVLAPTCRLNGAVCRCKFKLFNHQK